MQSIESTTEKLKAMRDELTHRIEAIEADVQHKKEPVEKDFAEQVTQRENDEVLTALDDEAQQTVHLIDAALARIQAGTYGICAVCGEPIPEQRLNAIPYATTCITCAEKLSQ